MQSERAAPGSGAELAPGEVELRELSEIAPGEVELREPSELAPDEVELREPSELAPGEVEVRELSELAPGEVEVREPFEGDRPIPTTAGTHAVVKAPDAKEKTRETNRAMPVANALASAHGSKARTVAQPATTVPLPEAGGDVPTVKSAPEASGRRGRAEAFATPPSPLEPTVAVGGDQIGRRASTHSNVPGAGKPVPGSASGASLSRAERREPQVKRTSWNSQAPSFAPTEPVPPISPEAISPAVSMLPPSLAATHPSASSPTSSVSLESPRSAEISAEQTAADRPSSSVDPVLPASAPLLARRATGSSAAAAALRDSGPAVATKTGARRTARVEIDGPKTEMAMAGQDGAPGAAVESAASDDSPSPSVAGATIAPGLPVLFPEKHTGIPHRVRAAVLELQHRRVSRDAASPTLDTAAPLPTSVIPAPASTTRSSHAGLSRAERDSRLVFDARPQLDKGAVAPRDLPLAKAAVGASRGAAAVALPAAHSAQSLFAAIATGAGLLHAAPLPAPSARPAVPPPSDSRSASALGSSHPTTSDSLAEGRQARAHAHPAEAKPAAPETLVTAPPALTPVEAASASRTGSPAAHASVVAGPGPSLAPQIATAAASLMQAAVDDETLHASAIGNSAHLRLQTASGQDLSVHIRVRDGIADIRVDGPAGADGAPSVELRASEVRTALAGEGISLGSFESSISSPGDSMRDLASATPPALVASAMPSVSSDSGGQSASQAQPATAAWMRGTPASVGELGSRDANINAIVNGNTNTGTNTSTSTSTNGYGYGHGAGSQSRSSGDPGADRDGGHRSPRNPAQSHASVSPPSSTSSAASSPSSDIRANRGVHVTA